MKAQNLAVGNVGARLDGVAGLWRIDTLWQSSEELEIYAIEDKELAAPAIVCFEDFWPLLDKFE